MLLIPSIDNKKNMEEIKTLLVKIPGVMDVSLISEINKDTIIKLEDQYEQSGVIGLKNIGIQLVLKCDVVFAILKDTSFRPPPGSTVFMVEDNGNENNDPDHLLTINDKAYHIIGEELISKKLPEDEEYMFISDDFILYPGRRKGHSKNPAYFLIPPIKFSELEAVKGKYKISNIISISPSTMADDYIRKECQFSPDKNLATILVGFDSNTPGRPSLPYTSY
jgi:hypothetical protein